MTYLLDSSVIIDTLNDRNERPRLLAEFSQQDVLLACCPINVTEVYMGMRPGEERKTENLLPRHLGSRPTGRGSIPALASEGSNTCSVGRDDCRGRNRT
jgi:hypothetical protein